MSGGRIVVDGLWRCLCPSFDEAILSRAASTSFIRTAARPRPRSQPCTTTTTQWQQTRSITTPAVANADDSHAILPVANTSVSNSSLPVEGEDSKPTTPSQLLHDSSRPALQNAPTPVIYEVLRLLQTQKGTRNRLRSFVKYLVTKRSQQPNSFLYEALIASNCDPAGSAREVRDILGEMVRLGIEPTTSLYRVALKALAVHPDYLLRNRVLYEMKKRWMDLGTEGRCSVALGMLREGQTEMAVGKMEEMIEEKVDVPGWVWDVFVVVLCQRGGVEEAVGLLRRKVGMEEKGFEGVGTNIWYLLLDEASRRFHYEGTRWTWDLMVATEAIIPSDGMCLNVLNTASRYSDPELAMEVINVLSARKVKLGIHHYEALVDCYANRDDVEHAFKILCIMSNAGISPDNASTRSIYLAFKRAPALANVAVDALFRLRDTHVLPLAALNVVLQGLCLVDDHAGAVDLYLQVRSLCACRPEAYTFSSLIETSSNPKMTQFLVAEMASFGLQPTREQNDKVVAEFLAREDVSAVFGHLAMVSKLGLTKDTWISRETAVNLARRCFAAKDERVWRLLDTARDLGVEMGQVTKWLSRAPEMQSQEGVQTRGAVDKEVLPDLMAADESWAALQKASDAGSG